MKNIQLLLLLAGTLAATTNPLCQACEYTVRAAALAVSFVIPRSLAIEGLQALCMRKYDSEKLCKRVGQELAPLAINNFLQNHINPEKRCTSVCNHSFAYYYPHDEAERILNGSKPHSIDLQKYVEIERHTLPEKSALRVLHLSDVHQDRNYVEKSSINCEYPVCCHAENGFPENTNAQAKPFGSKNCDSPPRLLESFLKFIQDQPQIEIVLATGDFSAHTEWEKTNESIIQTENQIQSKVRAALPESIFIKAEGNNDYVPDHQYDASKSPKLLKITEVTVGSAKLTFVALNTIAFDDMNLYLLGDQSYAIFQLILLEQILYNNQNVYILGHIPPTLSGTAEEYALVFRALVAAYPTKIKGQFYGHTHADQLTLNTYPLTNQATGFSFVCPSMSPLYIGASRSRVYNLAVGASNGVSDYVQYQLRDLSANVASWKQEYKFREKYGLPNEETPITVKQIQQIKDKIFADKTEQVQYLRTTGLSQDFQRVHCLMLDDPQLRRACLQTTGSITDKLFVILDMIRGQWGYRTALAK